MTREEQRRKNCIEAICLRVCGDDQRHVDVMREPLTNALSDLTDDMLFAVAELADLCPVGKRFADESSVMISLILDEDLEEISTFSNHVDDLQERRISLKDFSLLISTIRYLELMGDDREYYPYLKSHLRLMRYSDLDRSMPYHHNEELVKLVHEFHARHEEVENLVLREGIKDHGMIRVRLENASPALKDGLL